MQILSIQKCIKITVSQILTPIDPPHNFSTINEMPQVVHTRISRKKGTRRAFARTLERKRSELFQLKRKVCKVKLCFLLILTAEEVVDCFSDMVYNILKG